jgi:hypothetical protein
LFFSPVAYATGGYGLLYLFGMPDSSVTGFVCATVLGSVLGLLLCVEELLQTSRLRGGGVTLGTDAGQAGTAAGGNQVSAVECR